LEYIFIEISKFNKADHELETELDRWLFALKHMNHLQKIPVYLKKGIFEKLFSIMRALKRVLNWPQKVCY